MTEELEQTAEEYVDNLDLVKERNPELKTNDDFIKQAYLDGAKSRDKEVAGLKEQIEKMKCCQNCKWWNWSTCKHKDGFCKGRSNWEAKK